MKYNIKRKISVDITLDSSETIMFTKGGMHKVNLDSNFMMSGFDWNEVEITLQMEKTQQDRYDFITQEAKKHREHWDKINAEEGNKT